MQVYNHVPMRLGISHSSILFFQHFSRQLYRTRAIRGTISNGCVVYPNQFMETRFALKYTSCLAINFRAIASDTEIVLAIAESVRVITENVIVITDSVLIIIESVLFIKDCSSHNAYMLVQTCHITHPVSCTLIIQSAQISLILQTAQI